MGPHPPEVPVVAAVVERDGAFLVALRPEGKRHGGRWEFPGGKRLRGEDDREALRRELQEELRVEVLEVGRLLHTVRDPETPFVVRFVEAVVRGRPQALEHEAVRGCRPSALSELPLAPAARDFVESALSEGPRPRISSDESP